MCLVGTRPECVKMAPVIRELKNSGWADPIVVSTGQHRDLVRQIMDLFEIIIDHDLDVMTPNQSLASLSARIFERLDALLLAEKPDMIIIQGDTTSVMISSLAAFYRNIAVGHVEAGLRTNNIKRPFPEELNRVVAGVVSDLHFSPTQRAVENLLSEKKPKDNVYLTGNTVIDALHDVASRDLPVNYPIDKKRKLILVTAHRRENFGEPILEICKALKSLHDKFDGFEFVYPVHPNPNIHDVVHAKLGNLDRFHLIPPADYTDLVGLIKNSFIVITDSGGIQEEAPGLAKPVVVLREETERPEAVEEGVASLVGANSDRIIAEVERLITDSSYYASMSTGASPYGDGKAAQRIAEACRTFLLGSKTNRA
ncbi:non-hydrolyzing UDP-N-acetylglucosamine 2-epimerase [Zhengella mangrovi]|nr:UDP-N-acetylglucosamine 2-epimerase (non-hydrolyzing) [Zhengella mangrovi]